eukprot:scaffold125197_cov30-Tisochrysis_lutea.AAC.5
MAIMAGDSPRFKTDLPPRSARAERKSEPELLNKLLAFIKAELAALGGPAGLRVDQRLEVFRQAFDHFIAAFGAYKPLLLAIKQAYDDAYHAVMGDRADVELLRSRFATLQSDSAAVIAQLSHEAGTEQAKLRAELADKDAQLNDANLAISRLRLEVTTTQNTLRHTEKSKQELVAQVAQLVERVEFLQGEAKNSRAALDHRSSEMTKLRAEVEMLRTNQAELAEEDAMRSKTMEQLKDELKQMHATWVSGATHTQAKDSLKSSNAIAKRLQSEVAELRMLLAGGESRLLFPAALTYGESSVSEVPVIDTGWRGKRPHEIVNMLASNLDRALGGEARVTDQQGHIVIQSQKLFDVSPGSEAPLQVWPSSLGGGASVSQMDARKDSIVRLAITGHDECRPAWLRGEGVVSSQIPSRAFAGVARLRVAEWPRARLAEVASKLIKLRTEAERRHGTAPDFATLLPSAVALAGKSFHSTQAAIPEATCGEDVAQDLLDAAAKRSKATSLGVPESHAALACADALNFQAALALCGEPQALLFLQVFRGRLPHSILDEISRATFALRAGLMARGSTLKGERYALEGIDKKLHSLLPSRTEADVQALVHALTAEGNEESFPLQCLEPAPAEPMSDLTAPSMGSFRYLLQSQLVNEVLTLRRDIEETLRRAIQFAPDMEANEQERHLVSPMLLEESILRVDAAMPVQTTQMLLARVFGPTIEEDHKIELDQLLTRLFSGQYRRFSFRANPSLCEEIERELKPVGPDGAPLIDNSGNKGKKGKKGRISSQLMVSVLSARDAIERADPPRPPHEVAWLSRSLVQAGAEALGLSMELSPLSPVSNFDEAFNIQIPLEEFSRQLRCSLVQATQTRAHAINS